MLFVSFGFVAIFLPVIFGVYCIFRSHVKLQNILLLCASIFFYACFNVKYVLFLFVVIAVTFFGAILGKYSKVFIRTAIIINFLLLLCTKYMGFIYQNISNICGYNAGGGSVTNKYNRGSRAILLCISEFFLFTGCVLGETGSRKKYC